MSIRDDRIKESMGVLQSIYPDVVKVLMSRIDSETWNPAGWIHRDLKENVDRVLDRLEADDISILLDDTDFLNLLREVTGVQFKGEVELLERDTRNVVERLFDEKK